METNDNFSVDKYDFISYIGPKDNLAGYQKSYKLVLLKCLIECIIQGVETTTDEVVKRIRAFYLDRIKNGKEADYFVDSRIANIERSTNNDVLDVFIAQPYKVIHNKGYLYIGTNKNNAKTFFFHPNIYNTMRVEEWEDLLDVIDKKLVLYFEERNRFYQMSEEKNDNSINAVQDPDISVLDIDELSVRAKNILMRNGLFTFGMVKAYAQSNDLLSLKNMGEKTCLEISELLQNGVDKKAPKPAHAIETLFPENRFHLFVEYCKRNNLLVIEDLDGFDFDILLKEPGFGIGKLNYIKAKYQFLCEHMDFDDLPSSDSSEKDSQGNHKAADTLLHIHETNKALNISFLRIADISPKDTSSFYASGLTTVGSLERLSATIIGQMFGYEKGRKIITKLKIFEKPFVELARHYLDDFKDSREYNVFVERANNKTLQEIATENNLTRERVRQMESKAKRYLTPMFEEIAKMQLAQSGVDYLPTQDILNLFDDCYDAAVIYALKESEEFEYLGFAELFLKKAYPSQDTTKKLRELTEDFIGEGIYFFDHLSELENLLNDSELGFISVDSYLNYLIESKVYFYGDFVSVQRLPYAKLCAQLVKEYFENGINLYSENDINTLRNLYSREFGRDDLPEQNRALSARLSEYLIMCDRGKAKCIENIHYDLAVIEEIKKFIDESPLKQLYFSEIYKEFEGILSFTSDINNYNGLHGLLSFLYKNEYEFSRDCIIKKNIDGPVLSFADRMEMLIKKAGRAMSKTEIRETLSGYSDIMIANAILSSSNLLQWDYNYYNVLANISVSEDELEKMRNCLDELLLYHADYCSEKLIYNRISNDLSDFLQRNSIQSSGNLFYLIQKCFGDKYVFRRPHIFKNRETSNIREIIINSLESDHIIKYSEYQQLTKEFMWSYTTSDMIFSGIEKDYVRISEDEYLLKNDFNLSDENIQQIEDTINKMINGKYLSMIGFYNFDTFPEISYEWNTFLLITIIEKYDINARIVEPAIRDKRYCKDIIVSTDSDFTCLGDIVKSVLIDNKISSIDEPTLLSLLIVNHLVVKVLPKEIYDYPGLNYCDGYFNL
ncbi:MAG: hypothetical protein K6F64_10060 [Clostridia bacterium]|nr:hypothetical protein [Clostridia bacterium]